MIQDGFPVESYSNKRNSLVVLCTMVFLLLAPSYVFPYKVLLSENNIIPLKDDLYH